MSYDLTFPLPPGQSLPSPDALRAWFESRPYWRAFEWGATYANDDTGCDFQLYVNRDDGAISLTMAGNAPHTAGLELRDEVAAFVSTFALDVDDPQMEGMGRGPLDAEKLLAGWNFYNGFATKTAHLFLGQPVPPHAPAAKLESAAAWNRGRAQLDRGDAWFVPRVAFLLADDNTAETFVTWIADGRGLLPEVDRLVTPLSTVRFAVLADVLRDAQRIEKPAPHYEIDDALTARVEQAIASAENLGLPRMISASAVRTTEVVAPYRDGGLNSTDPEELVSIAHLAHRTNDHKKAFAAAKRALELDGTSRNAATLAALSGYYLAELAEALRYVDLLLSQDPTSEMAHTIRCGTLTDLARFDEAIAAADVVLSAAPNAMVENMKGDALLALGRTAEGRAAYERALTILEAELAENPDEGDTISRRAFALIGLGRAEEALHEAERALELVGDPLLTLQTVARANLALGRPADAATALEKIDANSSRVSPLASYYLGLAYAQLDRRSDAAEALAVARRVPRFAAMIAAEPLLKDL